MFTEEAEASPPREVYRAALAAFDDLGHPDGLPIDPRGFHTNWRAALTPRNDLPARRRPFSRLRRRDLALQRALLRCLGGAPERATTGENRGARSGRRQ